MDRSRRTQAFENWDGVKKLGYALTVLGALLMIVPAKAVIVLPYVEDFDEKEIGSAFADWDWDPVGEILGAGSTPFGESIPLSGNYLFLTGSQGQGTVAYLEEGTSVISLNLDFYSLPNPSYDPGTGGFRGGPSFSICDSSGGRTGWIIVRIRGEMWQDPDKLDVTFTGLPLGSLPGINTQIGTIQHGEIYHLDIGLDDNIVNVSITGPSTKLEYEYVLMGETLLADRISIGEGSSVPDEYGVGIDNITVVPEPCTLGLLGAGALVFLRKRRRPKTLLYVLFFFCLVFSQVGESALPSEEVLHMGSPGIYGEFDAAGYSDWYCWGQSESDRHDHG